MPPALHEPVLVTAGAKSVLFVRAYAGINKHGSVVMEVDTGPDVVVIVALTVIPTLCSEKALPCTGKAHFGLGIVYERLGRDIRRRLRLHLTARGHCLEPLIEQHPIHIRRIIAETMPCIYGKIRHQLVTGCFSITVYPIGDRPSGRSPVGIIHLPAVADVSIDDIFSYTLEKRLIPEGYGPAGDAFKVLEVVKQMADGLIPICGAFVATTIGGQRIQPQVHRTDGFLHRFGKRFPVVLQQHKAEEDVLVAPGVPVIEFLPRDGHKAHPTEVVSLQIGIQSLFFYGAFKPKGKT